MSASLFVDWATLSDGAERLAYETAGSIVSLLSYLTWNYFLISHLLRLQIVELQSLLTKTYPLPRFFPFPKRCTLNPPPIQRNCFLPHFSSSTACSALPLVMPAPFSRAVSQIDRQDPLMSPVWWLSPVRCTGSSYKNADTPFSKLFAEFWICCI